MLFCDGVSAGTSAGHKRARDIDSDSLACSLQSNLNPVCLYELLGLCVVDDSLVETQLEHSIDDVHACLYCAVKCHLQCTIHNILNLPCVNTHTHRTWLKYVQERLQVSCGDIECAGAGWRCVLARHILLAAKKMHLARGQTFACRARHDSKRQC